MKFLFKTWESLIRAFPFAFYLEADRDESGGLSGSHGGQTDWGGGDEPGRGKSGPDLPSGYDPTTGKGKTGISSPFADAAYDAYEKGKMGFKDFVKSALSGYVAGGIIGAFASVIGKGIQTEKDRRDALEQALEQMGFEDPKGVMEAMTSVPEFDDYVTEGNETGLIDLAEENGVDMPRNNGDNGQGETGLQPYQPPGSMTSQFWGAYHSGRRDPRQFTRDQQRNQINNAYRQYLGRDAAPEEISHWEAPINNGSMTLDMVMQSIANSEEAQTTAATLLPPTMGPGQMLPGAPGVNALRANAPISNLVSGATGGDTWTRLMSPGGVYEPVNALRPEGGGQFKQSISVNDPAGHYTVENGVVTQSANPNMPVGSRSNVAGQPMPAPAGGGGYYRNPYVENYVTPGNQYGTVEDMYRANLPNLQNALRTGRGDYEQGRLRGIGYFEGGRVQGRADFEEGYQRSVQAFEEAYNRAIAHLEQGYQRGRTDVVNMLNETREILAPYGAAGEAALSRLDQAMGGDFSSFRESPDYQFRLREGQKVVERQAAARGDVGAGGMTGRFAKELTRYGQDLASTEYGNWFARNQALAGMGLQAKGLFANALTSAGGTLANLAGTTGTGKAGAANVAGAGKASAAQTAAAGKASMEQWAGTGMAGMEQWAQTGKAGLTQDIADMTTRYGITARQADVQNALRREALGIDWAKLAWGESEAQRQRDWDRQMAERGYDIWRSEAQRNRQTSIWNSIIGGGLNYAGEASANNWWPFG